MPTKSGKGFAVICVCLMALAALGCIAKTEPATPPAINDGNKDITREIKTAARTDENAQLTLNDSGNSVLQYEKYLSTLSEAEIKTKKALRGDMHLNGFYAGGNISCASKCPILTPALPETIKEAVEASGGTYMEINDANDYNKFVDSIYSNGLTAIDDKEQRILFGPVDFDVEIFDPFSTATFDFFGPAEMKVKITGSGELNPRLAIFDEAGGIVGSLFPEGQKYIEITLPYTGRYHLQIFSEEQKTGKFQARFEVVNK